MLRFSLLGTIALLMTGRTLASPSAPLFRYPVRRNRRGCWKVTRTLSPLGWFCCGVFIFAAVLVAVAWRVWGVAP